MKGNNGPTRLVYRDLIRDAIYEKIVKGELAPGERIVELDWAREFNTSQAPVREALRDLESMGIIVSKPFKGAFVREMSVKDLRDIHKIRGALEGVALKNAIIKATDEEIEELQTILDRMKEYALKGDSEAFIDEDIYFHQRIVEIADTTELMKMWNLCNVKLWTVYNVKLSSAELIQLANTHDIIFEVLKNRQIDKCYEVMEGHFEEVLEDVFEENENK